MQITPCHTLRLTSRWVALLVFALVSVGWSAAQVDTSAQPQSDLSQAAQQAKAERDRQRAQHTANSEAVNKMATELSEESEQTLTGAPVGYRYYNFKAGDYNILVPADAEIQGRSIYGLSFLSSDAMGSRTIVVLGEPIQAHGDTSEHILRNASEQYIGGCKLGMSGLSTPVNGHPAAKAGFGMCSLHTEINGYAEFILGDDGYVMPMICGYPFLPEDLDPNPNRPIGIIVKKYNRQINGFRACDTIFPSLRFNQHGANWNPQEQPGTTKKAGATNALQGPDSSQSVVSTDDTSLGSFARVNKKAPTANVLGELKHTAPGYSSYSFRYCSKDECFDASLQVPVKAHKDEKFNVAYIGLFQFLVPVDDAVAVIQATKGVPTKLGFLTREELINTKIDWGIDNVPAVYFSGAGKAEVFNEELTTLGGMPARTAAFRSPTSYKTVITQQAAYLAPGVFVHIRCSAPEKVYADVQTMCQQVVRSLEVPQVRSQVDQENENNDQ